MQTFFNSTFSRLSTKSPYFASLDKMVNFDKKNYFFGKIVEMMQNSKIISVAIYQNTETLLRQEKQVRTEKSVMKT